MVRFERLRGRPVLVLGRAGMDFYADPPGARADAADRFFACLGGSSGNIAAGLARQGVGAAILSSVSDDAVGRFVRGQLQGYGVDTAHLRVVAGEMRTSLAVTETRLEDTQTVIYRNDAADFHMTRDDVEAVDCAGFGALVLTGTALAAQPSREATLHAMALARAAGLPVVLDIDYRPYSWPSAGEAAQVYVQAAQAADMVIGNDEEFDVVAGGTGGQGLARSLAAEGRVAIYKLGARGSVTYDGERQFASGIFPVQAIKPMGAGDSFMAGLLAGLAAGRTLEQSVARGAASAAIVVRGVGCAPAMPTTAELDAFLAANRMTPAA
ncbi:5-dehydro-2-deoxygluconokinase [Rhodobacteraceae bacterium 2CG4]|uniref:5-dehydro-2-deoxygluconokinase n=1 Tax=Halovulum marinum TaxID=2662447 RepID=A0A6L5Z5E9_9RHOB|nr:5-dehydro-2-deoxygluconokinase [Halovulum marinum]MSU91264.1 5-dehydro-2-deoxygluconokinase [Halovulum marinum]